MISNSKKKREFMFLEKSNLPLYKNIQHKFASNYALCIYRSNSICSFIPKNACTTMRLSVAIENGAISDTKHFDWVSNNNHAFSANLRDLVTATFTFVILRNPYLRVASAYLDMVVNKKPGIKSLMDNSEEVFNPDNITFLKFLKIINSKKLEAMNIHWLPQIYFLVYKTYDLYVQFEKFDNYKSVIEKNCNMKIYDGRQIFLHGNDLYNQLEDKNYSEINPVEISNLRKKGNSPSTRSMHNEETKKIVSSIYFEDINLYNKCFNTDCSQIFS